MTIPCIISVSLTGPVLSIMDVNGIVVLCFLLASSSLLVRLSYSSPVFLRVVSLKLSQLLQNVNKVLSFNFTFVHKFNIMFNKLDQWTLESADRRQCLVFSTAQQCRARTFLSKVAHKMDKLLDPDFGLEHFLDLIICSLHNYRLVLTISDTPINTFFGNVVNRQPCRYTIHKKKSAPVKI